MNTRLMTALRCAPLVALAIGASSAEAQTVLVGGGVVVREAPGLELAGDIRWRSSGGIELGAAIELGARDAAYLGGHAESGAAALGGRLLFLAPLVNAGPLSLDLSVASGVGYQRLFEEPQGPSADSFRWTFELALLAHARLDRAWILRVGAIAGVELELMPLVDLAEQTQLVTLGLGFSPSTSSMLYATVDTGGTYGFNGDNGKFVLRGTLGVRFALDGGAALGAL
jgi:hypothetical protein